MEQQQTRDPLDSRDRIVVLDDEPMLAKLVARACERHGFICDVTTASYEAESLITGARLAIIDANLAGSGDGLAFAQGLRKTEPLLPILLMSGDPEQIAGVAEPGRIWVLLKPFDLDELVAVVLACLAGTQDHRNG